MAHTDIDEQDPLLRASDSPNITELITEYNRATFDTSHRFGNSDEIRYMQWAGQSTDGKKWQKHAAEGVQVFPWDGASDTRIPLVDSIINDNVDLLTTASERASLRVEGMEVTDAENAALVSRLLKYLVETRLASSIARERELLAQWQEHYGWSALFVGWDQRSGTRNQSLTLEQLAEADQGLAALVADPATEDAATEAFLRLFSAKKRVARRVVRRLREEGAAEIPVPYIAFNQPLVVALKPWDDIAIPPETTDPQRARVIFRRLHMSEMELRAKVVDEGWDADWVDAAANTAGSSTNYTAESADSAIANISDFASSDIKRNDNLIEVVWAYARQLNEDGIPGIYYTVFSPGVSHSTDEKPLFGKHELLDYAHGNYPFVFFSREKLNRRISDSRGVSEIADTWQSEIKAQRDSVFDSTSFHTLPPILVNRRLGHLNKVGPAVQIPVGRNDDAQFMDPPNRTPGVAFDLVATIEKQAAVYFGRPHPEVPPANTAIKQQRMVTAWLSSWNEAFQQMFALASQFLAPEEIARILGRPMELQSSDVGKQWDFILKFDVRELDNEHLLKKLEAINTFLIPQDVAGVLDRAKLVEIGVRMISPDIADQVLVDNKSASQRMFDNVKAEISGMMLGMPPNFVENDPSAGAKLQMASTILESNEKAQKQLEADDQFKALMNNYVQNLQFSVQQEQNKQIGRIGVNPQA